MKKIYSSIRNNTMVRVQGQSGWFFVDTINKERTLITVKGLQGSFQRGHIIEHLNKKGIITENPEPNGSWGQ